MGIFLPSIGDDGVREGTDEAADEAAEAEEDRDEISRRGWRGMVGRV